MAREPYDWARCLTDLAARAPAYGVSDRDVDDVVQDAVVELVLLRRRGIRPSKRVSSWAICHAVRRMYGRKEYECGKYALNRGLVLSTDIHKPSTDVGPDYNAGARAIAAWRLQRWVATAPRTQVDALSTITTGETLREVGARYGHQKAWAAKERAKALRTIDGLRAAGVRIGRHQ